MDFEMSKKIKIEKNGFSDLKKLDFHFIFLFLLNVTKKI